MYLIKLQQYTINYLFLIEVITVNYASLTE
jgi:hypothetical protein